MKNPKSAQSPSSHFVHPTALCETQEIGLGTRVWAFAHLMRGARIGKDCNICDHVFVESGAEIGDRVTLKNNAAVFEGVTIEDDVFVGPNVIFTNDLRPRASRDHAFRLVRTLVKRGATLGANTTVVCGVEIGEYAMAGAGSVVTSDIPPFALFVGNPARHTGWTCKCGLRLQQNLVCECGTKFTKVGELIVQDQ